MARPTKLTEEWLDVAESVLKEDGSSLLTDEELLFLINDRFDDEKKRITQTTYTNWKNKVKNDDKLDEIGKRFFALIKKALFTEKRNLLNEVRKGENNWQSKAWIIERKFDDWNIKRKQDITSGGKPLPSSIDVTFNDFNEDNSE